MTLPCTRLVDWLPPLCLGAVLLLAAWRQQVLAYEPLYEIEGELTHQAQVLVLNSEESAALFDKISVMEPSDDGQFQLVVDSPPAFLDPLVVGWRLVAATETPRYPLSGPERLLVRSGLLAQVEAAETDEKGSLTLELVPVELESVVENGRLTIAAQIHVTSGNEDFPLETLLGYAESSAGHWLPAGLVQNSHWQQCPPEAISAEREQSLYLTPGFATNLRYQATLALKRELTFQGGRLVGATLEGRLCQGIEITPRFATALTETVPLWERRRGPYYRMVGWIPIMLSVNARLDAILDISGRLEPNAPLVFQHDSAGGLTLDKSNWRLQPRPADYRWPQIPDLAMTGQVEAGIAFVPRLELILYGSAGPYLEAEANTRVIWRQAVPESEDFILELRSGLTHRASPWSVWQDTPFEPVLYRGP